MKKKTNNLYWIIGLSRDKIITQEGKTCPPKLFKISVCIRESMSVKRNKTKKA